MVKLLPNIFKEVRVLRQEGKLHGALVNRTRILFVISLVLAGIVIFNILFRTADPLVALAIAIAGFVLGLFVFSRMSPVNWNEEKETVQAGKMDKLGYATIGGYVLFEIGLRTLLSSAFPVSATAYLLAGIFGTLLGRSVGTVVEIHNVFKAAHKSKE